MSIKDGTTEHNDDVEVKRGVPSENAAIELAMTRKWQWFLLLVAGSTAQRNRVMQRSLQASDATTTCDTPLTTNPMGNKTASHGIVFAIESAESDTVGQSVTSMGFHVNPELMPSSTFQYEVYALNADGFYADPDRGVNILDELSFDYRGQLNQWSRVASGDIYKDDLQVPSSAPVRFDLLAFDERNIIAAFID